MVVIVVVIVLILVVVGMVFIAIVVMVVVVVVVVVVNVYSSLPRNCVGTMRRYNPPVIIHGCSVLLLLLSSWVVVRAISILRAVVTSSYQDQLSNGA